MKFMLYPFNDKTIIETATIATPTNKDTVIGVSKNKTDKTTLQTLNVLFNAIPLELCLIS